MTGAEFKAELARKEISQCDFARYFKIDPGTVNRWCRGDLPVPVWAEQWWKLAKNRGSDLFMQRKTTP